MPYIIAVSGGSGSGKSFLSKAIRSNLPHKVSILSLDNYYKDLSSLSMEERSEINYDVPEALDLDLLVSHLAALKKGETIQVPQYDFATHTRKPLSRAFAPTSVIIVEGIMAFSLPEPRDFFDFLLYVEADPDVRLARRIERDIVERGRTVSSVIDQYFSSVKPCHLKYVEPHKKDADFVFVNNDNNGIDEAQMKKLIANFIAAN